MDAFFPGYGKAAARAEVDTDRQRARLRVQVSLLPGFFVAVTVSPLGCAA
jgi:hypothetical protein